MAKDHYVPQFYLRNFEIKNPISPIQSKHIYQYERKKVPKAVAIKKVAQELNFDTFEETEEGLDANTYNKLLKASEDISPSIISEILHNSVFSISDKHKEALSWFIALLIIRTPTAHQFLKKDILNFYETILQPKIQRDCVFSKQEIYKRLRLEQPDILDEEVEDVIKLFLEKSFTWEFQDNDNNKAYLRGFGVANLDFVVNDLMSKNWHLLEIEDDSSFITSDNPVSILFPRIETSQNRSYCDCPIFLPISSKKAFYIHQYKFAGKTVLINENQVSYFLRETIKHADTYLYSNTKSVELQKLFGSSQFNLVNLNYKYIFISYFQLKSLYKLGFSHFAEIRNE